MHCKQFIKIRASRKAPAYMYTYALVISLTRIHLQCHRSQPGRIDDLLATLSRKSPVK